MADETALFLSDAAPTGYMSAEPVIAIERFPERLQMAYEQAGSEAIDYTKVNSVLEELKEMNGGRGADSCIDAVEMEAHGTDRNTHMIS